MHHKKQILLVNLGTPDTATQDAVHRYLTEFLLDPRVIDIGYIKRHLLVRGIIIPRRKKQVTESYQSIWMKEGSPLLVYSKQIQIALQELLGAEYKVHLGMRYQQPSLKDVLFEIQQTDPKELIILPLFPQHASATSGSIFEKIMSLIATWNVIPKITYIQEFATFPPYIESLAASLTACNPQSYDTVLFSFHGLPKRQVASHDTTGSCFTERCCEKRNNSASCYRASCIQSAHLVAKKAQISNWSIAFQSRLGKEEWLRPYLIEEVIALAGSGKKKVLVISPSFVADCLETLYELHVEVKNEFLRHGGVQFDVVPCLNANTAPALAALIKT